MKQLALAGAGLALTLSGCSTDLHVTGLGTARRDALPAGFIYNLPAATVTPSATLRLAGCPADTEATAAVQKIDKTAPEAATEVQFVLSGDFAVDQVAGKPVLIDYRALADFLKTSTVGIERHPNGMLKSVNVTVEDESPALIASVAVIAADIALLSTGVGGAAVGLAAAAATSKQLMSTKAFADAETLPSEITYTACSADTLTSLTDRAAEAAARKQAKDELIAKTAALDAIKRNADTGYTPEELRRSHELRDDMLRLADAVAAGTGAIAKIDGQLSIDLDVAATPAGMLSALQKGVVLSLPEAKRRAFLNQHILRPKLAVTSAFALTFDARECTTKPNQTCSGIASIDTAISKLAQATATLTQDTVPDDGLTPIFAAGPSGSECGQRSGTHGAGCPVAPDNGIIYVEPKKVTLLLTAPDPDPQAVSPTTELKKVRASVPQLGTYLALPVHAGFGEKVALSATFATDGSLVTGSFGRPVSPGKTIAAAAAGVFDKAVSTRDAIEARKLKLLDDKVKTLTALQAIADANKKANPDPKAADPKADQAAELAADLAIANAKASIAEAALREAQANAKLGGGG